MRLYQTADGRIVGTQADAGKGYTQIEVPTDKAGLMAYLNAERSPPAWTDDTLPTAHFVTKAEPSIDINPGPPAAAKPLTRDVICESITKLKGTDLGMVALEVAARFEGLAK